jgi:type IV secretory pathway VirB9-like protein
MKRSRNFKILETMISALILTACLCLPVEGRVRATALTADFSGELRHKVYDIYARTDYSTTVVLPRGRSVRHVICGDMASWKVISDGQFVFIKPLRLSIQASLTIVTESSRVYIFNLVEASRKTSRYEVTAKVVILDREALPSPAVTQPARQSQPKKPEPVWGRGQLSNTRYKVKRNRFKIKKVFDDGVFTYIYLPKGQYRPAVFVLRHGKRQPVRCMSRGDLIIIHSLVQEKEKLLLVAGNKTSKIIKKKRRR